MLKRIDFLFFFFFLTSVAGLFEQCFQLHSSKNNRHLRAIELEKNFSACRTKSNVASKAWNEILLEEGIEVNAASDSVLQHILQHFWSTIGSVTQKEIPSSSHQPETQQDEMEFEAVSDHAGWAIKRARDIIKSSAETNLKIKKSSSDDSVCGVQKSVALELVSKLGKDVKQSDGHFRFIPSQEVANFFLKLHDVVDNLLSKSMLVVEKSKVITNCLQEISRDKKLRSDWFSLLNNYGYPKPVVVFVLEKIRTLFVKSKQLR